ncbi:hypothetical protein BDEG_23869 [Batrachochytrium dendrobatidis JEL423]|uniref:Uncharacterized protein n=1 Tax=Batrachochytrium dendrobatidis (strain JEL423) TaxID=403673 RepID=A0A177WK93_BATDL|nr:hypothetical protein BDEG_23869 [Batrachochytrium dendrobatidis JEL423]
MSLESMNIQHTSSALHMYQEWMPGVISYLESCPDVTDLKIAAYPPCPHALVSRWTCTHGQTVLTLPPDLVQFLKCSDGLLFTWNYCDHIHATSLHIQHVGVGCINVTIFQELIRTRLKIKYNGKTGPEMLNLS